MTSIDKLISVLEKEIVEINNSIIQVQTLPSKIESLLELFNEKDIIKIEKDQIDFLVDNLSSDSKLSTTELAFINTINSFDDETKNVIVSFGFDDRQKAILLNIKRKIEILKANSSEIKLEEYNKILNECKKTIANLKNNEINLITNLEFIQKLMNKNNIELKDQVEIFLALNNINLKIYESFKNTKKDNDNIIDENLIEETNLQDDELIELFASFRLNFNEMYNNQVISKQKLKLRLLKYGRYDNIKELLEYLVNNNKLTFVFDNLEIFTKILLYSSVDKIEKVIKESEENGIFDIIRKNPTILFPPIKEKSNKNSSTSINSNEYISGSMNNYLSNIELLKELNISVSEVYKKCSTFFIKSPKSARKVIEILKLYNMIEVDANGNITFSVLRSSDTVSKRIDVAIEVGCYQYCKENLSRLADSSVNLYRIKCAQRINEKSNSLEPFSPFRTYINSSAKLSLSREFYSKNSIYGNTPEETYILYEAVIPNIENKEKYDSIVNVSDNITISEISLNDHIIKQLDSLYMSKEDPLIYNFNGIIISRFKVLRYYETLISEPNIEPNRDLLMYTICLNSMLDSKELEIINDCVDKIKFIRRKIK